MDKLSDETILYVLDYFLDKKNKFNFATVNQRTWGLATKFSLVKKHLLTNKANALEINTTTKLIIDDRFYNPKFLTHFLSFAKNLKCVHFIKNNTYSIKFAQLFMDIKNTCTFIVSVKNMNLFQVVVEDNNNSFITIEADVENDGTEEKHIKTPEEIHKKLDLIKRIEKKKYYEKNNGTVLMKNNLHDLLPYHVNRLCGTTQYKLYQHDNEDINSRINGSEAEVQLLIENLCPQFVESVVILDNKYWFICTSFSTFLHNNKKIDDCADSSKVGVQENAVAFIRKKTRAGTDYFELTLRLSNIELLVNSGFFGDTNTNNITAFFGSSISNLPKEIIERFDVSFSKDIFIPKTTRTYLRNERILNQYVKNHSSLRWMFISQTFQERGYAPYHPLAFESKNVVQSAASLVLKAFVEKSFDKEDVMECISKIYDLPKKLTPSGELVLEYLHYLEDSESTSTLPLMETKRDILKIFEGVLAGAIKNKNISLAKKAEEEFNMIPIFEDEELLFL